MFFIPSSDGDVYRSELENVTDVKIARLGSTNYHYDRLELQESEIDSNRWDIAAVLGTGSEVRVVVPSVSSRNEIGEDQARRTSYYYGWGSAFQVGDATNSIWHFGWAHWSDIGMWARTESKRFGLLMAHRSEEGAHIV